MKKLLFPALVLVVIAIGLLHFFTPGELVFYHDTYRRLSYFPIVLGAVWFGVRGGLGLAVLSSIAFVPHLLLFMGHAPATYLSELTEIILYLAAGTVTGLIASKEARLRAQYQLLSQKLEKSYERLHQETALLIEVEEQLGAAQKLSALGQLSAALAHEIKNPLSSIKGTAEILLDEFPAAHPKREFVEILLKEVGRLNNSVEEVLRYSRGLRVEKAAGGDLAAEPLAGVIERVARLLKSQLRGQGIELVIAGLAAATDFWVDGGKLSQVFLNIILNAVEVLPRGGQITIQVTSTAAGLAIAIADNGPGVPAAERERIFAPFVSGKEGGTGLGLPISRKIVESYGGRLTLTANAEGGSCFTIFLPPRGSYPDISF